MTNQSQRLEYASPPPPKPRNVLPGAIRMLAVLIVMIAAIAAVYVVSLTLNSRGSASVVNCSFR